MPPSSLPCRERENFKCHFLSAPLVPKRVEQGRFRPGADTHVEVRPVGPFGTNTLPEQKPGVAWARLGHFRLFV